VDINFDSYADRNELLKDVAGAGGRTWSRNEDRSPGRIALDEIVGVPALGRSKSMRYDWPSRIGCPAGKDFTVGRSLLFRDHGHPDVKEVWVEVYLRFSRTFTTRGPCSGNPDYKTLLIGMLDARHRSTRGRAELKFGAGPSQFLQAGMPDGNQKWRLGAASAYWDGEWHRWRLHVKLPSIPSGGDAAFQVWADESLVLSKSGLSTRPRNWSFIRGIVMGANLNRGPAHAMSLWWGSVRAWDRNPGW